jgi:hypothetical protein
MKVYGVFSFVVGVAALSTLVVRRGRGVAMGWTDYAMMFIGLAGAIGGLAAIFTQA